MKRAPRTFDGPKAKRMREHQGISVVDMAEICGVCVQTVRNWERPAGASPNIAQGMDMARRIGCRVRVLLRKGKTLT